LDVEERAPIFTNDHYIFGLPEDSPIGSEVGYVHADDPDSSPDPVKYTIASPDGVFSMDENTGMITTRIRLDYESQHEYRFTVKSYSDINNPMTSSADVTVHVTDVDDSPPSFLSPVFVYNIRKSTGIGNVIGYVLARDDDFMPNVGISLRINAGGDAEGLFNIDEHRGLIYALQDLGNLDEREYKFTVTAARADDPDITSSADVIINVTEREIC